MRLKASIILVLTALMLCAALTSGFAAAAETASTASAGVTPEIQAKMASLQVPFVPNEGQVENGQVKFYAKTFAGTVFVTNDGITYALPGGEDGNWVIKEVFAGGKALAPAPVSAPGAPVNYYLGSMEKHLSSYQEITLGEVYDKINVNLRAYGNNVEKIFTVGPGGDPADIALKVAGSDKLSVNDKGELELSTGLGTVKLTCPAAYQVIGGNRADVDVTYAVKGDTYGFTAGNYDHAYPLIIDPLLASTYLGGSATDRIYAMALDATGDVYVAGYSNSPYFPPVTGGYSSSNAGSYDVFVAKLSGDLSQLLAATYLGGAASDSAAAIALDGTNNVYITGYTKSSGFPTTLTPYQGGGSDPDFFVAKLDGSHLGRSAATCFGGSGSDSSNAIALDSGGNVFVGGYTQSSGLSMTGYQKLIAGSCDGLVVKYDSNLQFLASTYLCDVGVGGINAMAVNQSDKVYVSGSTGNNYTTTANALKTVNTKTSFTDGFVSKLSNNLNSLEASTYLGGTTSTTYMQAMIFDAEENVIVTGKTTENDFPGAEGDLVGGEDAFVTKLDPDLSGTLVGGVKKPLASTLFGGDGSDTPSAIALDTGGNIYITGKTTSSTLPGTTGAIQTGLNGAGAGDVFVTKLDGNLTAPVSTYLGGTGSNDTSYALAVNRAGNVYVAGSTNSPNFPIKPDTAHVAQGTSGGGTDAFVAKLTGDLALNSADDATAPIWPAGKLDSTNVTETGLTLTWSGAMDNMGVTGYQLFQNGVSIATVSGVTYDVTGLDADTQYTFKVEAFDAKPYLSADGPSKTVTTESTYADHTKPTWPADKLLEATNVEDTSLTLTWTPATDNVGVSGYKVFKGGVEYATVSSATYTTVSGSVYYNCDVTGLALNNTYTFKMEAFDAAGNLSADGPGVTATTVLTSDTTAPYWPNATGLSKTQISASGYRLNWNAASDNVGVTAYRIYIYRQDSVATPVIITVSGGDTLYYDVTGLVSEVYYAFTIEAGDVAGNWTHADIPTSFETIGEGGLYLKDAYLCAISNNVSSTGISVIDAAGIPLRPAIKLFFPNNVINDSVWPNNSQCVVMQTAAGANVPVNVFRIPDTVSFGERNNFFVTPVNDLTPNTQYKIIIKAGLAAKNGRDYLIIDRIVNFTTAASATGAPTWPSGATLNVPGVGDTFLTLNWPEATSSAGIAGYVIFKGNDIIGSTTGSTTSLTVTGLTLSTTYNLKVEAFDAAGNWTTNGPSATVTTTATPPAGIPSWTSGQAATVSYTTGAHDRLNLSWPAATDASGITNYRITDTQTNTALATVDGNTLTYNMTGLTEATTYTYKIEALNLAGNWSLTCLSVNAYTGGGDWYGGGGQSNAPFEFLNAFQTTIANDVSSTGDSIAGSSNVPVNAAFKMIFSKNVNDSTLWSNNQNCFTMQDGSGASVPVTVSIIGTDGEKNNVFIKPASPLNPGGTYKIFVSANLKAKNGLTLVNNVAISFTIAGGADTTAPTWAGSSALTASNVTQTGLTLTWSGASDNVAVTGYKLYIYQGNDMTTPLNSVDVAGTTYDVTGLTAGTAYAFKVEAGDTAGNWSTNGPVKAVLTSTNDTAGSVPVTFSADVPNPVVSVGAFVSTSGSVTSGTLPGLDITANTTLNSNPIQLQVTIPAGVTVTANVRDWDGDIHAPTVQANSSITLSNATVNAVIEIGYGDVPLTFDQPVRILIPGQAGKSVGYVRNGNFTPITNHLSSDSGSALLDPNVDGWINSINNSDLVIWTKHFTQFVTYAPTGDSGGPSGGDIKAPTWPDNNFITAEKDPQTQIVTLVWHPATDNVGVTKYRIYHGTEQVGEVDGNTTNFTYTQPTGAGTGSLPYSVQAGDAAGNWSTDGPSKTLGGSNLPLIVEYGVYSYNPSSNTTPPTPIGSVLTSGTLTGVPTTFSGNTAIGIKFVTNVAGNLSSNKDVFQLLNASGSSIDIRVDRSGDGTSQDDNRNYLFVIPQAALKPGSSYRIIIGPTLTSNNGMSAGVQQEVNFTTEGTVATDGPTITTGSGSVDPSVGATVGLGDDAKVVIPANALKGTSSVTVDVKQVTSPPAAPSGFKIAGKVYEFTVGDQSTYTFNSNVGITLSFDPSVLGPDETAVVYYYDQSKQEWVSLGGTVAGSTITVQVDHFTKFAVFAVKEAAVPVVAPGTLTDITGHWAEANIRKLVELGAVSGYEDGTFKPDSTITRAEFATILVKAFKYDIRTATLFSDTAEHWAKDYVSTAAVFGIAGGYEDGSFRPDDLITREQMAVMVVKAAKLELVNEETKFADQAGISDWAKSTVATAVKNGIIKGYADNTFQPQGNAKRAEAVTVIVNALRLQIH